MKLSPFQASRRFRDVCRAGLIATFAVVACGAHAASATRPQPESTRRMIERVQQVSRQGNPLINPYMVGKAAEIYRDKIRQAKSRKELLDLKLEYATALMNNGQPELALPQFEEYDRMLNEPGLEPTLEQAARFLELKAVCYLRLGEQANCLTNHNAESCLLPISGGGVHKLPDGSRGAIATLNDWLELNPNPNAAWLLNIAHMTLGEYPAKVPPRWLIPPRVFESDYDIKHFPDVAGPLGLDVDDLAGGVVMDDFDRDGLLDIMASATGPDGQLRVFHNNGDGTFTEFTEAAGLKGVTAGFNLIQADYNNDGYVDVLVLRGAWQGNDGLYPNSLFRNNGDNTFTDVTEEAHLLSFHPKQAAVWFDFNGDGLLDLFVGNESIAPKKEIHPCELYRNNGDGTFTECAAENGLAVVDFVKAVVSGDYDNDGRPDLYLSIRGGKNRLFHNDGPASADKSSHAWRFTDVAAQAGVTEPMQSFSCWFWDYDNDGWLDLFVSGYFIVNAGDVAADLIGAPNRAEHARLYHNNRNGTFSDVTREANLFKVLHTMGCNFGDLDNDGWLDFYVGTGDPYLGTLIANRMFRNDGGKRFQDVTTSGGFGQLQKGHGIAFGDLNNDGAQDIYSVVGGFYTGDHYHNQLFANPGHGNHWLKLNLEGVQSNRSALGARIKVIAQTETGPREIHRVVSSGGSFGASPLEAEIGLGQAKAITRVEVFWPTTGKTQTLTGLEMDHSYAVRETDTAARRVNAKSFLWPTGPDAAHEHHQHAMPDAAK